MLQLVGKKIGMTHLFKDNGELVPLTMIQVYENCVLDFVVNQESDFDRVLLAFDKVSDSRKVSKSVAGVFNKKSLPLHKKIKSFVVEKGYQFRVGDQIPIDSVVKEGDKIDVAGITIGKGFAGVMKKWNFGGLEASHGVSISHRSHGSTGQRQDPGKVFKGKKMAGHMGVEKVTIKNLEVLLVSKEKLLVAVKGAIPGVSGKDVVLKIAKNF